MSYDIVTVGFCPQYYSSFEVPGSGSEVYRVTLNGGEGTPHCTCPAYTYSGQSPSCKHISRVWDHGCLWNPQWKDAGPNDLQELGIRILEIHGSPRLPGEACQGCGEDCIAVRIAV